MNILEFAQTAHAGQIRKYTGEDYILHPQRVSMECMRINATRNAVSAALLHDVVEDTKFTHDDILREFGAEISELVIEVTEVSSMGDGNRAERKAIDRSHLMSVSNEAKTIKLADMIDNMGSIIKHDPGFAKVYLVEKRALLEVLIGGNEELYTIADGIIKDYFEGEK